MDNTQLTKYINFLNVNHNQGSIFLVRPYVPTQKVH
jgi:hypothetical protein